MRFSSESAVVSRPATAGAAGACNRAPQCAPLDPPTVPARSATVAPRSHRLLASAVAGLAAALAACDPYVEGNGVYGQEDRTGSVGPFMGIHVEDGVVATVTSHAAAQSVLVSADANLVPHIRTEVQQDTVQDATVPVLHVWIDLSGGYTSTNPPTALVQVPDLLYALAKDRSSVDVTGAATPVFTARTQNGGSVTLVGPHVGSAGGDPAGDRINVYASDGAVDAHRYVTTDPTIAAYVELTGAAHVQLHADGPVTGTASGTSTLDNLAGSGSCAGVALTGTATTACH